MSTATRISAQASERGAVAAVVESVSPDAALAQVRVPDSRRALAVLAAEETGPSVAGAWSWWA